MKLTRTSKLSCNHCIAYIYGWSIKFVLKFESYLLSMVILILRGAYPKPSWRKWGTLADIRGSWKSGLAGNQWWAKNHGLLFQSWKRTCNMWTLVFSSAKLAKRSRIAAHKFAGKGHSCSEYGVEFSGRFTSSCSRRISVKASFHNR